MKLFIKTTAAALLVLSCQAVLAQPVGALLTNWDADGDGSGTGPWTTATNWNPNLVPNVNNEDSAVINGGGAATVGSVVSAQAGGLVLGQNGGDSGTLLVQSGGAITFVEDASFPADGSVRVGQGGTGTLHMTGGSLTAVSLTSAGEADSLIRLEGASTLTTATANLARTTSVVGPNVSFLSTGALTLDPAHTLVAEITAASHSPLVSDTSAALGGTLSVDFAGYSPSTSDTWDLISAPTISGAFGAIEFTGGASLGPGQAYSTRMQPSGLNTVMQLFIEQRLILNVDRASGEVTISNPGASGIELDGYSVRSASGGLIPDGWNPLATQLGPPWAQANPSANHISELIAAAGETTSTIAAGTSISLGEVYFPTAPVAFGEPVDNLVFDYTRPGANGLDAEVIYTGPETINNLTLYVDPATGETTLRNTSPFEVEIEAYTITSASQSLLPGEGDWSSLDDQGAAGDAWQEANAGAGRLSELMTDGVTPLGIHTSFTMGELFDTSGEEDLVFEFLLAGESEAFTGEVVYAAAPAATLLPGDYNNNGTVDAADFTVWRDALHTATTLPGDTSPGAVSHVDYTVWVNNFGASLASLASQSRAVPEPASFGLAGLLVGGILVWRRRG
ncbi:hypothetical protein Mal64_06490 [Pseudobythopirellula maris]|uniref:Ice-binding protein C-terminal domain-containing protein n=1 Tax=Pseudobythopirellula maris TaxID=2527991 RepID=A0A5C5ZRY5_9BACT|nr:PEP-CTERM sorting domain-containing protein [Pseudobythopirellula maris]TWT90264.1 hypothetical protein Mal64_06490 [Pseudobythopirellula maris]